MALKNSFLAAFSKSIVARQYMRIDPHFQKSERYRRGILRDRLHERAGLRTVPDAQRGARLKSRHLAQETERK